MNEVVCKWRSWEDVPLFLTTGLMCAFFQSSPYQLDKEAKAGLLQRVKMAGSWRYPRAGVRDYCRKNACDPFEVKNAS